MQIASFLKGNFQEKQLRSPFNLALVTEYLKSWIIDRENFGLSIMGKEGFQTGKKKNTVHIAICR